MLEAHTTPPERERREPVAPPARIVGTGGSVFARVKKPTLVSIVMPVYNEQATVGDVMERLSKLDVDGVEFEIVLVESNSSDGTRDIVSAWADQPNTTVIFEEMPRGKGAAVRRALENIRGEIVIIQDADLEYDVCDYPDLLAPLIEGRCDFVLGSRAVRGQPMRQMPGEPISSFLTNAGHRFFTFFFNRVYGVRLADPFTMYKVFRAECIEGLPLVANRFDFDWELVGKLVRRGFRPLEVPITYQARGFKTGKKVRWLRDPVSWIWAAVRFRFVRIEPAPKRLLQAEL